MPNRPLKIPEPIKEIATEAGFRAKLGAQRVISNTPKFIGSFFKEAQNIGTNASGGTGQDANPSNDESEGGGPPPESAPGEGGQGPQTNPNQKRRPTNPKNLLKKARTRLLIPFVIVFGIILLIGFFFIGPGGMNTTPVDTTNQLIIEKTGDTIVNNGQEINYKIVVTYKGTGIADIEVTDKLAANTEYISSPDNTLLENGILRWKLTGVTPASPQTISFIVKPKADNIWVVNEGATATITKTSGGSKLIDSKSATLNEYFKEAAEFAGIPPALMKAIGRTESGVMGYADEEVIKFSKPNWWDGLTANAPTKDQNHPDILRGYGYNTCQYRNDCPKNDVRGPMQFLLETWNNLKSKLGFTDGHDPDRRNLKDAVYGSAIFNKQNAEYAASKGALALGVWDETAVRTVARMYCAGPGAATNPSLARNSACGYTGPGSLTYDDRVWSYFLEYGGDKQ